MLLGNFSLLIPFKDALVPILPPVHLSLLVQGKQVIVSEVLLIVIKNRVNDLVIVKVRALILVDLGFLILLNVLVIAAGRRVL